MTDTFTTAGPPIELLIEGPAAGGSCIAHLDGQVVFVGGALPGETVRARIVEGGTAKFLRAEVTEVLAGSEFRVPDRRAGFVPAGTSATQAGPAAGFGGMEFAHVDLAHSRVLKGEVLKDQLARIAHLERDVAVEAAPGETTGADWRTRVQLAVDDDGRLGMLAPRSHTVVEVSSPPLACPEIAEAGLTEMSLPGAERVEVAWAGDHGAVIVRGECEPGTLAELSVGLPPRWSILAESGGRGRRGQKRLRVVRGKDFLTESVGGRDFRVAAEGFWQVHRAAPELLSATIKEALPGSVRTITDLYCGVGLLGINAAAATGAELFGVEGSKTAIENARRNAGGITSRFEAVRADRAQLPDSELIILDPPRAGAGKAVTSAILESSAKTVVYVSCDGATLARDLIPLTAGGFSIESLRGFDLFPLTAHVETVTVLSR